jgi:TRAP-type C4-dicarboxylate transport system substrate-binding protein
MGGIAGDELGMLDRIKKGQLDGIAAAHSCDQLAPSLRAMQVVGLFRSHAEILYVLGKLQPLFDKEMHSHGFVNFGVGGGFGEPIFFTRDPVRSLADLKRAKLWVWDLDEVLHKQLQQMGLQLVPGRVEDAARLYDEKRTDGFIAIPSAALAYQWSTQARYYTELHSGFLPGCLTISASAFDALPLHQQQALKQAAASLIAHFEDVGRATDSKLLNGLFQKQGLKRSEVSVALATEFSTSAKSARDKLGAQLVTPELMQQVTSYLEEYRASSAH